MGWLVDKPKNPMLSFEFEVDCWGGIDVFSSEASLFAFLLPDFDSAGFVSHLWQYQFWFSGGSSFIPMQCLKIEKLN